MPVASMRLALEEGRLLGHGKAAHPMALQVLRGKLICIVLYGIDRLFQAVVALPPPISALLLAL